MFLFHSNRYAVLPMLLLFLIYELNDPKNVLEQSMQIHVSAYFPIRKQTSYRVRKVLERTCQVRMFVT